MSNQGGADEPVDLRKAGAPEAETISDTPERDADVPYDPSADRESIRGKIAQWLVATLVVLVGVVALIGLLTAGLCGYFGKCDTDTVELKSVRAIVELILTPLVGLVGAVTGFYFGENSGTTRAAAPDID